METKPVRYGNDFENRLALQKAVFRVHWSPHMTLIEKVVAVSSLVVASGALSIYAYIIVDEVREWLSVRRFNREFDKARKERK